MKVGIVGLGLIGGSIGLKLKDLYDNIIIYGYDIDDDSVSHCLKNKIIDVKFDEEFKISKSYISAASLLAIAATPLICFSLIFFANKAVSSLSISFILGYLVKNFVH